MSPARNLIATICMCLFVHNATAQSIPGSVTAKSMSPVEAQKAFEAYLASGRNTEKGLHELMRVQRQLPKEKKNIDSIRALLAAKITQEERKFALRLLGEMYDRENRHGQNDKIFSELKSNMHSSNSDIAAAALFAYTRSGYDADYFIIMKDARKRGLINDDSYFGEHAHSFSSAPENEQKVLLTEISDSKNQYALQILANGIPIDKLSPSVKAKLKAVLEENEPRFPPAIGEYGGFENYYFENWLNSLASIRGLSESHRHEFIMSMLLRDSIDPRKILAYMSGPYGRELIAKSTDARKLDSLNKKLCDYANSFPTTASIQEPANLVQATLRTSHRQFASVTCNKYD